MIVAVIAIVAIAIIAAVVAAVGISVCRKNAHFVLDAVNDSTYRSFCL